MEDRISESFRLIFGGVAMDLRTVSKFASASRFRSKKLRPHLPKEIESVGEASAYFEFRRCPQQIIAREGPIWLRQCSCPLLLQ